MPPSWELAPSLEDTLQVFQVVHHLPVGGAGVAVLGGGTGGYVAAIRGAQLGLKVAVVETSK